jgi:hypothetical protein
MQQLRDRAGAPLNCHRRRQCEMRDLCYAIDALKRRKPPV